ncbi:hypothetical protein CICLE_v10010086mg [Citrus x clementina]|uniref:Uncharacterized protein n=1 Tax=Citrus clementina TaxID=85681 RepID=V4WFP4_CITCL|nr:hypothetical protein CICLE_v10010086mg [Citrus x clementina]
MDTWLQLYWPDSCINTNHSILQSLTLIQNLHEGDIIFSYQIKCLLISKREGLTILYYATLAYVSLKNVDHTLRWSYT